MIEKGSLIRTHTPITKMDTIVSNKLFGKEVLVTSSMDLTITPISFPEIHFSESLILSPYVF